LDLEVITPVLVDVTLVHVDVEDFEFVVELEVRVVDVAVVVEDKLTGS